MTDNKKVATFRVKLNEYYEAEKETAKIRTLINALEDKALDDDDDLDDLYETHKSLYDSLSTAEKKLNPMIKKLCEMFNYITDNNIKPMEFVPYLNSQNMRRLISK